MILVIEMLYIIIVTKKDYIALFGQSIDKVLHDYR
jgi:hypothetical protein